MQQLLKEFLKDYVWYSKNPDVEQLLELPIVKITGTRDKKLFTIRVEGYRRGLTLKEMHPISKENFSADYWLM